MTLRYIYGIFKMSDRDQMSSTFTSFEILPCEDRVFAKEVLSLVRIK